MHTITAQLGRVETRGIAVAAAPAAVLAVVGDPRRLPDWAPAFARGVRPDGDDWLVDTGAGQLRITVRVSREHGTVDLLRAGDTSAGAFMRVLPNHAGSEFVFTILFPHGTPEAAVAAQMATIEEELEAVRAFSEAM